MTTATNAVGLRELLEAGVHFGHQTRRWNPKMRRYIFGEREGIYIVDLLRTEVLLAEAQAFVEQIARGGGIILFVGTKKQARDSVKDAAERAGMPYVNHRWLGGLLTNYQTISQRIRRLHDLEGYEEEGQLELLPTRERMSAIADLTKLRANLGGVKHMQRAPDAIFVVDVNVEEIAVREAQRLRIPVIGLVDTNCDPDGIDYVIPGNDDAIRSCRVISDGLANVIAEARLSFLADEEKARVEAEEQARIRAEEQAKIEAEQAEQMRVQEAERLAAEAAAVELAAAQPPEAPAAAEAEPAAEEPAAEAETEKQEPTAEAEEPTAEATTTEDAK
jgi:small subunit ribosomal protein S2